MLRLLLLNPKLLLVTAESESGSILLSLVMSSRVTTSSMQKQSAGSNGISADQEMDMMKPSGDKLAAGGFSTNLKLLSVCTVSGMAFGIAAEKGQGIIIL